MGAPAAPTLDKGEHAMVERYEFMFYELMWRSYRQNAPYFLPWWVQMYFRRWSDNFDQGLFSSKEGAFCSNAYYRYWNMVGVKDYTQESLVGQCGELEPVYDEYTLLHLLFDPASGKLYFPQDPAAGGVKQSFKDGYLPIIETSWESAAGIELSQSIHATVIGASQRSAVLSEYTLSSADGSEKKLWFCLALMPFGPTGFKRHDSAGRDNMDRLINKLTFNPAASLSEPRLLVNDNTIGPVFSRPPDRFGLYGNGTSWDDPQNYITNGPFNDLAARGGLNGATVAVDYIAGMCTALFAWQLDLTGAAPFLLDVRLPVDDFRSPADLAALIAAPAETLKSDNLAFWTDKLDRQGVQIAFTPVVSHLFDLFRICRANILILSDNGAIHPGPTIYDDFWVRDSSVEGIAAALAGDGNLALRQYADHYPTVFNQSEEWIGPVSTKGFFGGTHEKNDCEWDSNGEALWAIGKFDRIKSGNFGTGMFYPYVLDGARWIRDNRSVYGLLNSGWSAEHIGDKDKPHYWDDFWGIAGLYEAARLGERMGAPETGEIWASYHSLASATADSIRWVLGEQRRLGQWQTFIPTGPGDVNRNDSTMVGALDYFHPCRLYMGAKLGADIDWAARMTLETIWGEMVKLGGGFFHESAWNCFGPYLTLQLAHAFLYIGDVARMDACLAWAVGNAAYAKVSRGVGGGEWEVVQGGWNEQHCLPIATDFDWFPDRSWYMGDIPHGWACAEFMLLIRDLLFFEADEDGSGHIFIAPGVPAHWLLSGGNAIKLSQAPTIFGGEFGYSLQHDPVARTIVIEITSAPQQSVWYGFRSPFGGKVSSAVTTGGAGQPIINGLDLVLPAGMDRLTLTYV